MTEDTPIAESPLRSIIDSFGHNKDTFDLTLPDGTPLSFKMLKTHGQMCAHRDAREQFATTVNSRRHPIWDKFLPVERETACAVFNLAATCSAPIPELEWLELANVNGAIFEALSQEWSMQQAFGRAESNGKAVDDLGKDSEPTTASGSPTE